MQNPINAGKKSRTEPLCWNSLKTCHNTSAGWGWMGCSWEMFQSVDCTTTLWGTPRNDRTQFIRAVPPQSQRTTIRVPSMQPNVISLWPTHAGVWHHEYQHNANSCHNVFVLMLLLVQSHKGSANLGETCKCGVASVAADAVADCNCCFYCNWFWWYCGCCCINCWTIPFALPYMHQSLVTP